MILGIFTGVIHLGDFIKSTRLKESLIRSCVSEIIDIKCIDILFLLSALHGTYGGLDPGGRFCRSWWRHQMETFSVLLAICAGNSPVTGEFPAPRPVTRNFVMFSLIWAWMDGWINNREAGDLRRHCTHYHVTVMIKQSSLLHGQLNWNFNQNTEKKMFQENAFKNVVCKIDVPIYGPVFQHHTNLQFITLSLHHKCESRHVDTFFFVLSQNLSRFALTCW